MSVPGVAQPFTTRRSRAGFLLGGGIAAAGLVLAEWPDGADSAPSKQQDAEILRFALELEHLQAAFYGEAYDGGKITGEARQLARVAGGHERAHIQLLEQALGGAKSKAPRFRFGSATSDPAAFLKGGRQIEDIVVRAYNGQGPNLSPAALGAAGRIVSVEARHAAWIRDLAGVNPAPDAAEPMLSAAQVKAALRDTGFLR